MATDVEKFNAAVVSAVGSEQSLTEAQQKKACESLGIVSYNDQPLTVDQAIQVLKNFGFQVGSAAFANSIYGGRDLLTLFTEAEINAKVAAGDFSGMFVGDYITKTITVDGTSYTRKWLCAGFDHYFHTGATPCTTHHIVMIPDDALGTATMNPTATTSGGFLGSAMWKTTLPKYTKAIQDAFGASHVMKYSLGLSSQVNNSVPSMAGGGAYGGSYNITWVDVYTCLPTEAELFGTTIASSSCRDVAVGCRRFPLMYYGHAFTTNRGKEWWLVAVSSTTDFEFVSDCGFVGCANANDTVGNKSVRPVFCWC